MKKIFLLVVAQFMFMGCSLKYIDAPISVIVAPNNLIWEKNYIDNQEKNRDLLECAQLYSRAYNQFGSNYSYIIYDICMIKKGYDFVTKPNGFPNQCEFKHNAVGSAIEYLADNGQNVLDATSINLFGPAYNAQNMANLLYTTSDGRQTSVTLQNHIDDFVGGKIGGNPSTGGQTPPGSNTAIEWYNMFVNPATAHSCYGNGGGKDQCGKYWGTDWQNSDSKTMIINATNGGGQ